MEFWFMKGPKRANKRIFKLPGLANYSSSNDGAFIAVKRNAVFLTRHL